MKKCSQCSSTETYVKSNGVHDWRHYDGKTYCKICYRRIMRRLAKMYPEDYFCACGCGGTLKNNGAELFLYKPGHSQRGELHPNWRHDKPFNPADYTLIVKKP